MPPSTRGLITRRLLPTPTALRGLGQFLFACLGFFVVARIGSMAGLTGHTATPFWAASGFGLALALNGRSACLLGLACGSFLAAWWALVTPAALVVALSDVLSAWLAALLYRRIQGSFPWLGVLRDGLALSSAALIVAFLSAATAANMLAWCYALSDSAAVEMRLTWFLGDSLGVIIAGPVFITICEWATRPTWPTRKTVLTLLSILMLAALVSSLVLLLPERKGVVFLFFLLPAAAAYWASAREVKAAVLISAAALLLLIGKYDVTFVRSNSEVNRLVFVIFLAGLGLSWLVVVAETSEKFRGLPLLVFASLAFVAARLFANMEKSEFAKQELRADQVALAGLNLISAHTENFLMALRPGAYLLREKPEMTLASWASYVRGMRLEDSYGGMRGMGAIYPVKSENLGDFFARSRQQGIELSALVNPRGAGDLPGVEHMVLSLWHSQNTLAPVGVDISAYNLYRAAAEMARDTGKAQLLRLMPGFIDTQNKKELPYSFVILWPVYRSDKAPGGLEERRRDLVCWLTAVFQLSGIRDNVLSKIPIPTELAVYGGTEVQAEALLVKHHTASVENGANVSNRISPLTVLDRRFTLVWSVPFDANLLNHVQAAAGSITIILAGAFLSTLVFNLRNFGQKVERQVDERTKELRLANLALMNQRAENRKLAQIAMEAKNPMFFTSGDLKIQWINRSFTEFYGYTIDEVFGKMTREILAGPDSDLGALGARRDTFYIKKQPVAYEILHYTKAGAKVWVSVSIRPILDQKGEFERVIGVVTDLTALKDYQQRLEAATAKAEQANEAKSTLLANVSHELRTPLNVIMGNLQLLQAGNFGRVENHLQTPLQSIRASSQHLLRLIGDLLDMSKAEAGMLTLKPGPVSVTKLVEDAAEMMRPSAQIKNLHLTAAFHHRTDLVEGDAMRLMQILINLLSNAVKFTREGGTITVRVEETTEPADLLFHVSDTGAGIHPHDHERIFLEFEQGEQMTHSGGTGLGLPIARRLAVLHGGALTVASEFGRGSTFTVRLPIKLPAVKLAPTAPPPEEPATTPLAPARPLSPHENLILAVDDFAINLEILCMYLEGEGYRVIRAMGGEEAIAQAQDRQPNLILMDVKMAGMDGLEAIRRLKANPQTRDIPVIALTAFASAEDSERCLAAGAVGFVSKPINFPQLGGKIAHHLSSRV